MDGEKPRMLIADDHSVVRKGIIKSITKKFPDAEFFEASNGAEVLQAMTKDRWNLVIMDISMPGRNGLEILSEIKAYYPNIPVIIFSMYPEDQFAVRAIKAGASAYISKDISTGELEKAIVTILKGERYFTPSLMELITDELLSKTNKKPHELLSDREYQVFMMISAGKCLSCIAEELNLSVKTISVYRSGILKKMNLKNNSEIMHYAFRNKLVV
ncbi:MAG: response regulator transcription factor [Prolixibacteraceae bacterium]|nr:response regulator transcription factor [Prolixibacteraceae bacterium]